MKLELLIPLLGEFGMKLVQKWNFVHFWILPQNTEASAGPPQNMPPNQHMRPQGLACGNCCLIGRMVAVLLGPRCCNFKMEVPDDFPPMVDPQLDLVAIPDDDAAGLARATRPRGGRRSVAKRPASQALALPEPEPEPTVMKKPAARRKLRKMPSKEPDDIGDRGAHDVWM